MHSTKWILGSILFLATVIPVQAAYADNYFMRCDGCSVQQKGNLVLSVVQDQGLPLFYDYYVYGLDPFSVQRFGVEQDMSFLLVYPLNNNDSELEPLISALYGLAGTNNGSLTFTVDLASSGAGSNLNAMTESKYQRTPPGNTRTITANYAGVYDYLNSSSVRRQASNSAMSSLSGAQATFFSIVRNFTAPIINFDRDVHVRLLFEDGEVLAKFNYNSEEFEYVEGTARDSNGNLIPGTPEDFAGGGVSNYYFTGPQGPGNLSSFLNHAQMMGVPIINGSGGGSAVACVEAGGQIVCEVIIY